MDPSATPEAQLHEEALVRAFIIPAKRRRMVFLLRHKKRRKVVLRSLAHFGDLDVRWSTRIPGASQSLEGIEEVLRAKGAPATCYVICDDSSIDGRFMPLKEALEEVSFGNGAFLSCIPGKLGYFEGEGDGERYILERHSH